MTEKNTCDTLIRISLLDLIVVDTFLLKIISLIILMLSCYIPTEDKTAENNVYESLVDDRFEFDPEECNVANGKWVFNRSIKPFYSDRSCPYLDRQVSCVKNGRLDSDYRHWEWQPEDCTLPRLIRTTVLIFCYKMHVSGLAIIFLVQFLFLKTKNRKWFVNEICFGVFFYQFLTNLTLCIIVFNFL